MQGREGCRDDDRGSVTALVAVLLVVIVGAQALLVDVLRLHGERWLLQTAADAAAMAASASLPATDGGSLDAASAVAFNYAALNGVAGSDVSVQFATDAVTNDQVTVSATRAVPITLGSVFGIGEVSVQARATAQVGTLSGLTGVLPWGFVPSAGGLDFGALSCLKLGSDEEMCPGARGVFNAIDIDDEGSGSASIYRDRIVSGSTTQVRVGDTKQRVSGNMTGPTKQGVGCTGNSGRISGNTTTFEELVVTIDGEHQVTDWANPRIAVIPFVEPGANDTVTVIGFGAFFIEGCGDHGSVLGRFIRTVVPGGEWGRLDQDFGARSVRLVE